MSVVELIIKILHISLGYMFGLMVGLIIGTSGLENVFDNKIISVAFLIGTFCGCLSLFIFFRNDKIIDEMK